MRSILTHVAEDAAALQKTYGNVSAATVGTVQRQLLVLENQGVLFFAEPALTISDSMRTTSDGRGIVNILAADKLIANPRLYATFLLWILSELRRVLKSAMSSSESFFFDEAIFVETRPKALLTEDRASRALDPRRAWRSRFPPRNPLDVPETVLAQLGNRVQHALRAFTPRDQKSVKAAADTFRQNKDLDTAQVITELGKGEALVSFLEGNGVPSVVQRTMTPAVRALASSARRSAARR